MKKLWGGRFKKGMHPALQCFSYSLHVDGELLGSEMTVNYAWVKMLGKIKVLSSGEVRRMVRGLQSVEKELKGEPLCSYLKDYEDVHTLIQSFLEKKVGALAKKIHTGRSRNDLVVTSTRVWVKNKLGVLDAEIRNAQAALVKAADKAGDAVIAGLTHLKKAQPVLMAHHLLAYVEMLEEDRERLADGLKRVDVLPLGAAALAGSSLPLDRKFLARELGFSRIAANSMAVTSDRAFLAELLSGLAILWVHLSRLSEDFILWNSEAFGYIELDDAFATGSSLMPQKKNPDVFELIRGRSAAVLGQLQAILAVQKGLPLAYNRDLQEDKPPVFDAVKKTVGALELLALTVSSISFNFKAMAASVQDDNLYATDLLEYLVRKKVIFSEAHEIVGTAVRYAQEEGKLLREMTLKEWKRFSPNFDETIYDLFDSKASVSAKKTAGSTQPGLVKREIAKWKKALR
jgi:argininosuccinate lyase